MNDYRLREFKGSFFITGFMGTGKSAIGSRIAKALELPFQDLDKFLEKKEGKSIPEIFNENGEPYFREKEWEYLLEITKSFKGVVALGGGALQNQHIVDHLKIHGLLIFLDTPLEIILKRVLKNPKRPIVRNNKGEIKNKESLKRELETLYSNRKGFYNQAEVKLTTTGTEDKDEVVKRLLNKIKNHV
ncbi:MAG: shikimate kinase [Balneola sp.]|nr:shikimate kinase [Balneola sp.]HCI72881.1 shikimate kinase [Balneola sp.]|tara:strand:+ start:1944 stop:2507 length:564 start_codon:yes stop_codon:yes gene_type:complete